MKYLPLPTVPSLIGRVDGADLQQFAEIRPSSSAVHDPGSCPARAVKSAGDPSLTPCGLRSMWWMLNQNGAKTPLRILSVVHSGPAIQSIVVNADDPCALGLLYNTQIERYGIDVGISGANSYQIFETAPSLPIGPIASAGVQSR